MKKIVLFAVLPVLFLAACNTANNYTSHKKYNGIDYSAYERPYYPSSSSEDFTANLPGPSVLGEAGTKEEEKAAPSADEDFTSEEVASSYGRYTDVTVVAAAKRVKLGASANTKNMLLFQKALDEAYKKALRTYRPTGFTYSMASVGAVNPLSDIEVSCILGEQSADQVGQATCNLFFTVLVQHYNTLLEEAKKNAAL